MIRSRKLRLLDSRLNRADVNPSRFRQLIRSLVRGVCILFFPSAALAASPYDTWFFTAEEQDANSPHETSNEMSKPRRIDVSSVETRI
jgi:hypothetical protein